MRLLSIQSGNTKIKKTEKHEFNPFNKPIRMASLSMMPDLTLCPMSKKAECFDECLKTAGRGAFSNVAKARQAKTDFFHNDKKAFLLQLKSELKKFDLLCQKQNKKGVVRLNVLSDIPWEKYNIPQLFPNLFFYDYTKRVNRLGKTPKNYRLMFSFSGGLAYQKSVLKAPKEIPMAVVFKGSLPTLFNGREVVDGDNSDLFNAFSDGKIIGLLAKGKAKKGTSNFCIDNTRGAQIMTYNTSNIDALRVA